MNPDFKKRQSLPKISFKTDVRFAANAAFEKHFKAAHATNAGETPKRTTLMQRLRNKFGRTGNKQ